MFFSEQIYEKKFDFCKFNGLKMYRGVDFFRGVEGGFLRKNVNFREFNVNFRELSLQKKENPFGFSYALQDGLEPTTP